MVCHPSTHRGAMGSSKEMSNNRPSAPLFVRGTESLLASSASFLTAGWGEWGLLALLLLLPPEEDASHSAPAPAGVPPTGEALQELLQRVLHALPQRWSLSQGQSFRNRQLQRGLLSSQVQPGPCSSTGFPWGYSLLRASPCCSVGSSMGCRRISASLYPRHQNRATQSQYRGETGVVKKG